jgi:hypothetical protein
MGISTNIGSGLLETDGLSWARMTDSHTALAAGSLNFDVSMGGSSREGTHFKIDFPSFIMTASTNLWTIPM